MSSTKTIFKLMILSPLIGLVGCDPETDNGGGSQSPSISFNVTSNGGRPNMHLSESGAWQRNAELNVFIESNGVWQTAGTASISLDQSKSSGQQRVDIDQSFTLEVDQEIQYSITSNGYSMNELSCWPTGPDAFDTTSQRFERTITSGTNALNVRCGFAMPLTVTVNGLPANETVALEFTTTQKLDLDDFNQSLTILHSVTGTDDVWEEALYWVPGTPRTLTDSLYDSVTNTSGGLPFAPTEMTVSVNTQPNNAQCSVTSPFNLTPSAQKAEINCTQTAYIPRQRLKPFNSSLTMSTENGVMIGYSLAASGDLLVAGTNTNAHGMVNNPPVYVYSVNSTTSLYDPLAILRSGRPTDNNFGFGQSIATDAINGRYVLVGAHAFNSQPTDGFPEPLLVPNGGGAAFIYTFQSSSFGGQGFFTAPLPQSQALFGKSVALSTQAEWLAIGAPGDATNFTGIGSLPPSPTTESSLTTGAVYLYLGGVVNPGSQMRENWSLDSTIKPNSNFNNAEFGNSVDIDASGRYLLVGMPKDSVNLTGIRAPSVTSTATGLSHSVASGGAVLFYRNNQGDWVERAYIKPQSLQDNQAFGDKVAVNVHNNVLTIAISAPGEHKVYVYRAPASDTANGAQLLSNAPMIIDRPHNSLSLKDLTLSPDGQRLAVSYTGDGSAAISVDYRFGYVASYGFEANGQAWALTNGMTAQRAALSGDSQDGGGRDPDNNRNEFGSAVVITNNAGNIVVGANEEACGFVSSTSLTPVDCGVWNTANFSGSVYLFK